MGELSSIFAHELGQPLSAMRYFTRSLLTLSKKPNADPTLVRTCIEGLQTQITNAGRILDRVRSYAKQGAARDKTVDLSELAKRAIEELVQSKRLRVPVDFRSEGPVFMHGDEVELRILVHNLVKNAAEAASIYLAEKSAQGSSSSALAPVRAVVRIAPSETVAGKCRAEFCVENDGPLLTNEMLSHLGEPLHTNKKEGLGLGLLICKSIAEAHRAKLLFEARSELEGGGLRVRFRAALVEREAADKAAESMQSADTSQATASVDVYKA